MWLMFSFALFSYKLTYKMPPFVPAISFLSALGYIINYYLYTNKISHNRRIHVDVFYI